MSEHNKYEDKKKIVFYETSDQHARFLIRLFYDNLKQGEFFRALMKGYVEEDENIFKYIQQYKLNNDTYSKTQTRKNIKERKEKKQTEKAFRLSEEEAENLFDLIAQEMMNE